ncbi:MAG: TonB-dependent receptor plug domain-containing protein, partial [Ignavibacteriales bacterium]
MAIFNLKSFFLLLFIFSSLILAQNEEVQKTDSAGVYKLSNVVITATKTNTSTLELANSISVIDSSEIVSRNKINLFDLLNSEYGLSITQPGGLGALSTINIRGSNPEHTLVLIDGVEMNMTSDAANVYDFANLPAENINRIEVLRGPQSTLYGSDAMAGVINIITNKGVGKPSLQLSAEGGSYNTFKGSAGFSGNINNFNYLVSLGRTQSDGISSAGEKYGNTETDGYEGHNISSRFGYDFNEQTGINFFLRFTKTETDLDQFGGQFGDDPTYIYDLEEFTSRVEGFFNLFDGLWDQKIGASYYKNSRKYDFDSTMNNPASSNSLYEGKKYKVDWQNNFHLFDSNIITVGIDFESEIASAEYYYYSSFGPFESILPESETTTTGFYLQDQLQFSNDLFASAGIRYDNHSLFGGAFTYRFAPAYIFWSTGTKLKATVGTGFNAPSIFYLYDPAYGNAELNPEKNFGWDAGIEQYFWSSGISAGITYFSNDFTDLFGTDENFRTINIQNAESNGVEVYTKAVLTTQLDIKLNYTYTNTINKSEESTDYNQKLLRRPENKIGLLVNYNFTEMANINLEVIYAGKSEDKDFST